MQTIVLGSSSSTRATLLESFCIPFIQRACGFDEEQLRIEEPSAFVYHATKGKLQHYLKEWDLTYPVLCADTVVSARGEILRKAKDKEDARRILRAQSGSNVRIITCMMYKSHHLEFSDISSTEYLFLPFDHDALEVYLEGDAWQGKAGACMVEGFCKPYIQEVRGLESTAMGLSVEKLLPFLD